MSALPMIWCGAFTSIARDWRRASRSDTASKLSSIFEPHETIATALQREKNIKHWSREWKIDLIVAGNPTWRDLYEEIVR
jgi:predicted GIY-YIG superfamily endonuclease